MTHAQEGTPELPKLAQLTLSEADAAFVKIAVEYALAAAIGEFGAQIQLLKYIQLLMDRDYQDGNHEILALATRIDKLSREAGWLVQVRS